MKSILISLVAIVCVLFGYNYLNGAQLPQECVEAKAVYFESLSRLKSLNTDGSLTTVVEQLAAMEDKINEVIDPNKRYKRSKIKELRTGCIQYIEQIETGFKQLDIVE